MLLKEIVESAFMMAEDEQQDQKNLVATLLQNYCDALRKQAPLKGSAIFTPKSSGGYAASAESIIGLRRSFFNPTTTTNPFNLIHHRNSISPDRNTRSESTFYNKTPLNESYSEGVGPNSTRSSSMMEHGKICELY
mmetsp:Transcript_32187/g.55604  ORF Transcript_32187/g.55604 Transcript_32187/m.55604 type:complete len:136 (-) Transcript_32187:3289-3696(-)